MLPPEGDGHVRIRIFNPLHEMPFAGHPILGTAFVLGAPLQLGVIRLETGRGVVPVTLERDESGRIVFGRMEQPVPRVDPFAETESLLAALGVDASELPVERYDNGAVHLFVALPTEADVVALGPEPAAIARFEVTGVNCFAGSGVAVEEPDVLARRRGCGHGLGGRASRVPPRAPRPDRLGRRDRDRPGRRDRAPLARCTPAPRGATA